MDKETVDPILAAMIESGEGVSDLLFVVGKPPHIEMHGKLKPIATDPPDVALTAAQIDQIADLFINGNERLRNDYASNGSCDCSYADPDRAIPRQHFPAKRTARHRDAQIGIRDSDVNGA